MEKSLPKKSVRCLYCKRFLFNIIITAHEPFVGEFGHIADFKCPGCKKKSMVAIGVSDKDKRNDAQKIEDQIRKGMQKDA